MVDMPRNCEHCRLRLIIEYNRLLAWGKAVGLIEVSDERNIADRLGTNASELSGIISRIGWLLEQFRDLGERWKELSPQQSIQKDHADVGVIDQLQGMLSLDAAYMKLREERKRVKGTNHLITWMTKSIDGAKEVLAHPRRIRWAAVDKDAFEALLKDLHALTERLHQLVSDFRLKKIADVTSETYRELVLTRNDVQDLRDMLGAVTAFMKTSATSGGATSQWRLSIDEEFQHLLRLKEINRTADFMLDKIDQGCSVDIDTDLGDLIKVRMYEGAALHQHFEYANNDGNPESSRLDRARGTLRVGKEIFQAWVEWRYNGTTQHAAERVRVMALAQMLHVSKPQSLYAPTCLGYIDDTATSGRFGWIFAMPSGSKRTTLKSLHDILDDVRYKPTLRQRVALASKLASSLLYLHTCDWIHKGIHSGNVVFPFEGDVYDPEEPVISGFDYSRSQSSRTISSSFEPRWDIYRWPGIQNEAPRPATSRKTYDIYSLGLVLLEIAHWKTLPNIMCLEDWPENASQNAWIRAWLLGEDDPPFDSNPLLVLRHIAGDRYWKAVNRCIEVHGDKGLHVEEHTDQTWSASVGMKLQDNFNALVVQELKEVSI
jgi:hypothetical protein